jgi:hypothetical protein
LRIHSRDIRHAYSDRRVGILIMVRDLGFVCLTADWVSVQFHNCQVIRPLLRRMHFFKPAKQY